MSQSLRNCQKIKFASRTEAIISNLFPDLPVSTCRLCQAHLSFVWSVGSNLFTGRTLAYACRFCVRCSFLLYKSLECGSFSLTKTFGLSPHPCVLPLQQVRFFFVPRALHNSRSLVNSPLPSRNSWSESGVVFAYPFLVTILKIRTVMRKMKNVPYRTLNFLHVRKTIRNADKMCETNAICVFLWQRKTMASAPPPYSQYDQQGMPQPQPYPQPPGAYQQQPGYQATYPQAAPYPPAPKPYTQSPYTQAHGAYPGAYPPGVTQQQPGMYQHYPQEPQVFVIHADSHLAGKNLT